MRVRGYVLVATVFASIVGGFLAGGLAIYVERGESEDAPRPARQLDTSALTAVARRDDLVSVMVLDAQVVTSANASEAADDASGPESGSDPDGPGSLRRTGLEVVARVPPQRLHQLPEAVSQIRVKIDGGPSAVDCGFRSFGANLVGEGGGGPGEGGPALRCALPRDLATFVGIPAQMAITVASVDDAIVLPVTAVDGSATSGVVYVQEPDESWRERRVALGINDGLRIQIVSGLDEGEVVADPVPSVFGDDAEAPR